MRELRARAASDGASEFEIDAIVAETCVVVLPWQEVYASAANRIAIAAGVTVKGAEVVVNRLRTAIADHADRNAQPNLNQRSLLSRTDIDRLVADTVAIVDHSALEEAIRSGCCEPVDFDSPLLGDQYYEGVGTQPGHLAAGLVVPRPVETDMVLGALDGRKVALVVGPSGVGKSATMWSAAYVARHVRWYRVRRLLASDVEPLRRLARAVGAGTFATVGFVVDGVGIGTLQAWDDLCRVVIEQPGVVLLGSCREEDLLAIATLSESEVVHSRLDESVAERIHAGLVDRRATSEFHWREAFEEARGLTLEFTHLLTNGRRLSEVVRDQVRARVREQRSLELDVLAPVTFAHQWGASLDLTLLQSRMAGSDAELRGALSRLLDEHLIVVNDNVVGGLHQLRSAALSNAIHAHPPPTLAATARAAVRTLRDADVAGFVTGVLTNMPELSTVVVDELAKAVVDGAWAGQLTEALRGARAADFINTAKRWTEVLAEHGVPGPITPLTVQLALLGTDLADMSMLDPRVVAATATIRDEAAQRASPLRDALVGAIGMPTMLSEIEQCISAQHLVELLAGLAHSGTGPELARALARSTSIIEGAETETLAALIQACADIGAGCTQAVLIAAGGESAILDRLVASDQMVIDLDLVAEGGELILRGRRVHISDRLNPAPERTIKDFAVLGLRCLPTVDRADLMTVRVGGDRASVADHDLWHSGLVRRYVHGPTALDWNQERCRAVNTLLVSGTRTARLSMGRAVLNDAAAFLRDLGTTWIVSRNQPAAVQRLNRASAALISGLDSLPPPTPSGDEVFTNDPIFGIAKAIATNLRPRLAEGSEPATLAAFVRDTILKDVAKARQESWDFLGLREPPPELEQLGQTLADLYAVLAELAWGGASPSAIATIARTSSSHIALSKVARWARERALERQDAVLEEIRLGLRQSGFDASILAEDDEGLPATSWPQRRVALLVEIAALGQLAEAQTVVANLVPAAAVHLPEVGFFPVLDD